MIKEIKRVDQDLTVAGLKNRLICENCNNNEDFSYFQIQNNNGEYITLCNHCAALYMAETLDCYEDYTFTDEYSN